MRLFHPTNWPASMFSRYVGFSVEQIAEVIDFVRETGKLQFALRHFPTKYVGVEFLEPIFRQLKPPIGMNLPPFAFFEEKEFGQHMVQFDTLAELKVIPDIMSWSIKATNSYESANILISQYRHTYACLKALGYSRIVEKLEDSLVTDIGETAKLIMLGGCLITQPFFDPIATSFIYDTTFHELAADFARSHLFQIPKPTFPNEIGEFLLRKLVHCAPSLGACKQLTYIYEDQDVYKLRNALAEGIAESKIDLVAEKSEGLSLVLEEIWADQSLSRRVRGLKIGVPIMLGVVGTLACGPIGGLGGILTGLGFSVGDKAIAGMADEVAEKIAALRSPNWEVVVFDFKKKYQLNKSSRKIGK
jgi:hypothetical protein